MKICNLLTNNLSKESNEPQDVEKVYLDIYFMFLCFCFVFNKNYLFDLSFKYLIQNFLHVIVQVVLLYFRFIVLLPLVYYKSFESNRSKVKCLLKRLFDFSINSKCYLLKIILHLSLSDFLLTI